MARLNTVRASSKSNNQARLNLEGLEERKVLSVTNAGGLLLNNVAVQGVYYGSDWNSNTVLQANGPLGTVTYQSEKASLDNALRTMTLGSSQDLLDREYNVDKGSVLGSIVATGTDVQTGQIVDDAAIRTALSNGIANGSLLPTTSGDRLYMVFVDPKGVIQDAAGITPLGYHDAFTLTQADGSTMDVHYAVVSTHGFVDPTARQGTLSIQDTITVNASRVLANAETNPNGGFKLGGLTDAGREVGDIAGTSIYYIHNSDGTQYAFQRVVDHNDQVMTPGNAVADVQATFFKGSDGNLYGKFGNGAIEQLSAFAKGKEISNLGSQGIDHLGHAMVAFASKDGQVWVYQEEVGLRSFSGTDGLPTLAKGKAEHVEAGQAVVYVQYGNDQVYEVMLGQGKSHKLSGLGDGIGATVATISAGTSARGVNQLDVLEEDSKHTALAFVDGKSGSATMGKSVKSISAGTMGYSALLHDDHTLSVWTNSVVPVTKTWKDIAQVTLGSDDHGSPLMLMITSKGKVQEAFGDAAPLSTTDALWANFDAGMTPLSLAKPRAGTMDVIFSQKLANGKTDIFVVEGHTDVSGLDVMHLKAGVTPKAVR